MNSSQQRSTSVVEPVVFRFPPANKRDSSSSSTTGLLTSTQDSSPTPQIQSLSRTGSLTGRSRVIIKKIPSSHIGTHSSLNAAGATAYSRNKILPTILPTDWNHTEVFIPSGAVIDTHQSTYPDRSLTSSTRVSRQSLNRSYSIETTTSSSCSRTSIAGDVTSNLSVHHSSLAEVAMHAPRISRTSSRRSCGAEWTRHHWNKVKSLEEASERARRCSKLSSGFAPLMVFGGLVFVCIGISASTNTGKDKERLKNLSAAPLAMGIFMIILGIVLIVTWFACRSRSHKLNQRLLHGSHLELNLPQGSLMHAVVSKLYTQTERGSTLGESRTPALPATSVAGASETEEQKSGENEDNNERNATPNHHRTDTLISRETSV